MDRLWRALRHEVASVQKSPIDYVNEYVWFATQPIEEPPDPRDLERIIKMIGVQNLCFSTDYPHWDNDMPMQSLRMLMPLDREQIMRNARNVLRLSRGDNVGQRGDPGSGRGGKFKIIKQDALSIGVTRLRDGTIKAVHSHCPHKGAAICKGIIGGRGRRRRPASLATIAKARFWCIPGSVSNTI